MATTIDRDSIAGMQKLSQAVYMLKSPKAPSPNTRDPKIILIFAWMAAQPRHAAKYPTLYTSLFPSSTIILVQSTPTGMMVPPAARSEILPAVKAYLAAIDGTSSTPGSPDILVHTMSNGGATMYRYFREALAQSHPDTQFPPHVTLIDSAPGRTTYVRGFEAFSTGLPAALKPLVHIPLILSIIFWTLAGGSPIDRSRIALAEKSFIGNELRRVYVYGDADKLIPVADIEENAELATKEGLKATKELFVGGAHVSHLRTDEARYREVVRKLWVGA